VSPLLEVAVWFDPEMTTPWTITFDCADPARLAAFWKLALDYQDAPPPTGFESWKQWLVECQVPEEEWNDGASIADPGGVAPRISFLKVPEGKTAKNRLHLDVQVGGGRRADPGERWARIRARVELLLAAGATVLARHDLDGRPDHVVLADPEGNELCVV
jgi:Glyoxalase-like domain